MGSSSAGIGNIDLCGTGLSLQVGGLLNLLDVFQRRLLGYGGGRFRDADREYAAVMQLRSDVGIIQPQIPRQRADGGAPSGRGLVALIQGVLYLL